VSKGGKTVGSKTQEKIFILVDKFALADARASAETL